ncbi:hypothetical protein J1N35_018588 [Gossypium stocksii]|uniref:Uncharacterized protein n=1 Tax=Gossypium stocksii TaxID=47602 RepID=A0A9D4A7D1_9ROSI|nr:hypothetical protein J1N35_018588 [Gossypium stocksii]
MPLPLSTRHFLSKTNVIMDTSTVLNSKESLKVEIGPNINGSFAQGMSRTLQDPLQVPIRPITRARAKRFREALNGTIRGLWNNGQVSHLQDESNIVPRMVRVVQMLNAHPSGLGLPI